MNEIKFIVELDACDFPGDVENELCDRDISTHYQNEVIRIDWDGKYSKNVLPLFKKWLVETYGEEIKQHSGFAIWST